MNLRTYDQYQREKNSAEEEIEDIREAIYAEDLPIEFEGRTLEELSEVFSDFLFATPDRLSELEKEVAERTDLNIRAEILARARARTGSLSQAIEELRNVDLDIQTEQELLQTIATTLVTQSSILNTQSEVMISQLEAQYDILSSVEPFSAVSVSGTNSIENANVAEPVIPDGDQITIVTRALFIKASSENQESIAIGDDEVDPTDGYVLEPGQPMVVDYNLDNTMLYMASDNAGDVVELLGVR